VLGKREHIKDLIYRNTEQQGRTEQERKAVYDFYCENEKGEKFSVGVQNASHLYFMTSGSGTWRSCNTSRINCGERYSRNYSSKPRYPN
jgi:hypothetical protein